MFVLIGGTYNMYNISIVINQEDAVLIQKLEIGTEGKIPMTTLVVHISFPAEVYVENNLKFPLHMDYLVLF